MRSWIWVGGGVTHGPLAEKNYKRKISKKMRAQALFSVLSRKLKDGEIIFVETLAQEKINTKNAQAVMESVIKAGGWKIGKSSTKKLLTAIYGRDAKIEKSFRNLASTEIVFVKDLNPLTILNHKYLLIENPEKSVEFLNSRG